MASSSQHPSTWSTTLCLEQALWITTAAQMGMGFILPFALTFVAIPLETFVNTLRRVVGMLLSAVLKGTALTLRIAGNGIRQSGIVVSHLYDIIIFAPLALEHRLRKPSDGSRAGQRDDTHGAREMPI